MFTVSELQFQGSVVALNTSRLNVKVKRGTLSAERANTLSASIARDGRNLSVTPRSE